jgi:septation ring formation regulator EzrA
MNTSVMASTEQLENLMDELKDLVEERNEKQEYFDEVNQAGEAFEADKAMDTIEELTSCIEDIKIKIERELRSI